MRYLIVILFSAVLPAAAAVTACDFEKSGAKLKREIRLKDGVVKLGTLQVSKKNQDPIVAFFRGGKQIFCRDDYDKTPVDARAVTATADADHFYVAFSTDGGANGNAFTRFTKAGWISSYGKGGGPKVAVILKLRKKDGTPVAGTYLIAQKADGKTNSIAVKEIKYDGSAIHISAESWFSPLRPDRSSARCEGKSPFLYSVTLEADLSAATQATAAHCQ